VEYQIPSQIA